MASNLFSKSVIAVSIAAVSILGLASCASDAQPGSPSPKSSLASQSPQTIALNVEDAWVKATDEDMTAGFGVISNDSDTQLRVVSVSSPFATSVEMHETVMAADGQHKMQEIAGGFVIDPGAELVLEPGGDHLMLMGVTTPIVPGETVTFTLVFDDGNKLTFDAPAKDFSGANENYEH